MACMDGDVERLLTFVGTGDGLCPPIRKMLQKSHMPGFGGGVEGQEVGLRPRAPLCPTGREVLRTSNVTGGGSKVEGLPPILKED